MRCTKKKKKQLFFLFGAVLIIPLPFLRYQFSFKCIYITGNNQQVLYYYTCTAHTVVFYLIVCGDVCE